MISCIFVLYMALLGAPFDAPASQQVPDALYAQREDLSKAREAAQVWAERLAQNPRDFESAWKLARARYWLGGHAPDADRKQLLEDGVAAARAAVTLQPDKP